MKKYFLIFLITIFFVGCSSIKIEKEENVIDGIAFKTEFENFNQVNDVLSIDKENPFKYLTELNVDTFFSGSGILFLGYPTSSVSRGVVDLLLTFSKEADISEIYYCNLTNHRDLYTIEGEVPVKEKDGSHLYTLLMKYLSSYAKPYHIIYEDKDYFVDENRLYGPSIVFIENGKIIKYFDQFNRKEQEEFSGFSDADKENYLNAWKALVEKMSL